MIGLFGDARSRAQGRVLKRIPEAQRPTAQVLLAGLHAPWTPAMLDRERFRIPTGQLEAWGLVLVAEGRPPLCAVAFTPMGALEAAHAAVAGDLSAAAVWAPETDANRAAAGHVPLEQLLAAGVEVSCDTEKFGVGDVPVTVAGVEVDGRPVVAFAAGRSHDAAREALAQLLDGRCEPTDHWVVAAP